MLHMRHPSHSDSKEQYGPNLPLKKTLFTLGDFRKEIMANSEADTIDTARTPTAVRKTPAGGVSVQDFFFPCAGPCPKCGCSPSPDPQHESVSSNSGIFTSFPDEQDWVTEWRFCSSSHPENPPENRRLS